MLLFSRRWLLTAISPLAVELAVVDVVVEVMSRRRHLLLDVVQLDHQEDNARLVLLSSTLVSLPLNQCVDGVERSSDHEPVWLPLSKM